MEILIAGLGIGLINAIIKLAEIGIIDPALERGLEPVKKWLTRGYDSAKDAQELSKILLMALDDLNAQYQIGDYNRLINTLKLTGLSQLQHDALAAASIEMSHNDLHLIPDQLLKVMNLEEQQRGMLASFLYYFRKYLARSKKYQAAIFYANDLDQIGQLGGLTQHILELQEEAKKQTGWQEALARMHHLELNDQKVLDEYMKWARERWKGLVLPLIRKRPEGDFSPQLRQVFVPLKMRDVTGENEARKSSPRQTKRKTELNEQELEKIPPLNLGQFLNKRSRSILIGTPGSGKTTLLRRIALAFAEGRASDDLDWQGDPLLPIFTRLRNFSAFLAQNKAIFPAPCPGALVTFFRNQYCEGESRDLTANFFEKRLEAGHCLILLDGLDEVTDNRSEVAQHIREFIVYYGQKPGNRFILSSRPKGYETVEWQLATANLAIAEVLPLEPEGIQRLISNLFLLIDPDLSQRKTDTESLVSSILSSKELTEIASTPLFCSALVQVYKFYGAHLPERKVDVLEEIVNLLLVFWRAQQPIADGEKWAVSDGTGKERRPSDAVIIKRKRLSYLAFQMQEKHVVEVDRPLAIECLAKYLQERERQKDEEIARQWADDFLINSHEHSGLLVEHEPEKFSFLHKSFMEYLAATWLVDRNEVVDTTLAHRFDEDDWWEPVLLLAGAHDSLSERFRSELINQLLDDSVDEMRYKSLILAGKLSVDMAGTLPGPEHDLIEAALLNGIGHAEMAAKQRAQCGDILARLGDPRPYVMDVDAMRFCFVPEGEFLMGEGKKSKKLSQSAFWMGEHPVSQAQFDAFVKQDGYLNQDWRTEAMQDQYWSPQGFKGRWDEAVRTRPVEYRTPFGLTNHPVVGVSWYEARAFTSWLTQRWRDLGWLPETWEVILPNETQWEKAARGGIQIPCPGESLPRCVTDASVIQPPPLKTILNPAPQREYPWQGAFDSNLANTAEAGLGATCALGCFPGGASPYGILDLSGNVWEWQENWYDQDKDGRSIRGGAWDLDLQYSRCALRYRGLPGLMSNLVGFRCALSLCS